ncbi:MAG: DNA gyrase subunit A [Deltaproteobacteria bacterium]|nr:DNA gyrase subunit A [Deltaproteobacteria bacterium]
MLPAKRPLPVNIEDEMRKSYMDYAMSVIIGRALPDVRDGLKPVHRRVLYAMHTLGNHWNKPFKKSARVVGDVIGKYHPHGDAAVYDTIVRMSQDFSLRYPLVQGQGNFGSVDGDSAAAMRYTEVRLTRLAHELLADIDKDTVDFGPNYDDSLQEPLLLPAPFPNLLVNGSAGIAVGMATNIPPHNLVEVIDAIVAQIEDPRITIEELMEFIPGPDFPTGSIIYGKEGIRAAYQTGKGVIHLRARALVEKQKGERDRIIITEIPYQVNKARLVEKIALLMQEKRIEGISEVRDESDRDGMRIVLELKKDEVAEVVLNQLYKLTQMQVSFGIILLAIVDNRPSVLNLKELIGHFIEHRKVVVTRRSRHELREAEARAHILQGLLKALGQIDAIIALIKGSKTPAGAKETLVKRFAFTEAQAQAILDMRLQRLTGLEREKVAEEFEGLSKEIARLRQILGDEGLLMEVIVKGLRDIQEEFGDPRQTQIIEEEGEVRLEDLILEEDMVVTITHTGYIKRTSPGLYRSQRRGGKGRLGITVKDQDFVEHIFIASTHHYILFSTDRGKVYWLKVHQIPQAAPSAKGKALVNLITLSPQERITAILPVKEFKSGISIIMATKKGMLKKTALQAFSHPRSDGIIALRLGEGDGLVAAKLSMEKREIFLGTRMGKAIRFKETQLREMGRGARGVRGINLGPHDRLVALEIIQEGAFILSVTEGGYGKRTSLSEYRCQNRGGKGVINTMVSEKNGPVVGILQVVEEDEVILITDKGKVLRLSVEDVPLRGRNTIGVRLIGLEEGARVVGLAKLVEKEKKDLT